MTYTIETDLRELEAMASHLTPYLYHDDLYGMISNNLPRLTVGGLLLRLHRLEGLHDQLSEAQRQRIAAARTQFEQRRQEWAAHYDGKVQKEIEARLRSFGAFLDETDDSPGGARSNYPAEATRRTIIEHLKDEAQERNLWNEEFAADLQRVDRRLQAIMDSSKEQFVWSDMLKPGYPKERYWWLYALPQEK
jgi:hypothetical protein